jgi:hypothetical protein
MRRRPWLLWWKTVLADSDNVERSGIWRWFAGAAGGFEVTRDSKAAKESFCRMSVSQSDLPVEITYLGYIRLVGFFQHEDVPVCCRV